jgi:hypothetical protein
LRRTVSTLLTLTALALATATTATPASASDSAVISGAITGYECGDNCYLTILTTDGEEIMALCVADACQPWNEVAALPPELLGAEVEVVLGTGTQTDASGNNMGDFPAFLDVAFYE